MKIDEKTGKPIIEISDSGLKSFNSCPRRFAYNKIIVNPLNAHFTSTAAEVGQALHEACQDYIVNKNYEKALLTLARAHPIELTANDKASQYSLEASIITFNEAIKNEIFDYEVVMVRKPDGEEVPAIELYFRIVIDFGEDCPVIFHLRGYIDKVLRNPYNGNLVTTDIKTTTPQGRARMESKYEYDYQPTSYGIPVNALLGEFDEFDVAILAIVSSDREPTAEVFPYKRTKADIEDYQLWLLDTCERMIKYYKAEHWPRNPSSCVSFGKLCQYHPHCHLRTLKEMQMRVNPSMRTDLGINTGRIEEDPWLVVRLEV